MDDTTGWCAGCLRTLDEIACWAQWADADKRAVARLLGARRREWRRLHSTDAGLGSGSGSADADGSASASAASGLQGPA